MDINLICKQGSDILLEAHKLTAIPALYISLTSIFIISIIVGLITFDTSEGKFKFFVVWLISLIMSGFIIVFLTQSPNTIQSIYNYFNNFFT